MECSIILNRSRYSLTQFVKESLDESHHWALPAQSFLKAWLMGDTKFPIETSGSTGTPKVIKLSRSQMIASAKATIETLKIPEGTKALLCINTAYIGGQMMLVRAMVGNWGIELVSPAMNPSTEASRDHYGFAALVPLQVLAMTKSIIGKRLLNNIDKIIIGGAPISEDLIHKIEQVKGKCFHTYGMTETVSHIGLKALNGPNKSEWFDVVIGNEITQDDRSCLQIKGSVTEDKWISTNDLVEIKGTQFKWLGRADLVVNTGGIKVLIESLEERLNKLIPEQLRGNLLIWKAPDRKLGEKLIGIVRTQGLIDYLNTHSSELKGSLPSYHLPKEWLLTSQFKFTENGKLDRSNTYLQILSQKHMSKS